MSRVQPKTIPAQERKELLDELWSLVVCLETRDEIENFFRDLLSETESVMLARRVRIARLLLEGKSYEDICELMNASEGTIASVHRWLQGRNEGYATILPRLEKELGTQRKEREKHIKQREAGSFEWLKKRYPLHFLLFNLLDLSDKPTTKRKKKKS
ncbi:helix-turn-helix domain-containing protein [Patescibacteria group bacterium]|nr:helix-turn-helix domain-containing protein [Patescibacteria group bacterium]